MTRNDLTRLVNIINRIDGFYYRLSQVVDVSENTTALLYALSDGKPHTQKEIAENWLIPKTTINSIVKKMIKDGYMGLSATGGKEKNIGLTETGKLYAASILAPMIHAEGKAIQAMNDTRFIDDLEKFTQAFEKAVQESEAEKEL